MDKLIKPGTDTNADRFRKHQFAAIEATAQASGKSPSSCSSPTFESGLATAPLECPSMSEMDNMLPHEKPNGSLNNRRPPHYKGDGSHQVATAEANVAGNQATPACIWEQFGSALQTFEKEKNETFELATAETVKLSRAISEKILDASSGIDPKKLHDLVDAAWRHIKQEQVVHFSLSPHDLEALKQVDPTAICPENSETGYVFHENVTQDNNTCMVKRPPLDMTPSLSKQLALIERKIATWCQEQPDSGPTDQTATTDAKHRSKPNIPYKGRP